MINEGFALGWRHEAPVLRYIAASARHQQQVRCLRAATRAHHQARAAGTRPLHDLQPQRGGDAGNPEAAVVRRIFYSIEELLELHLSILEGVRERYETPFFDNLKKYAQRPIGTFHALPIARGKSVFQSDWIRDMGEFYGINLFLAESSATTGGLDSLLEPTSNIRKAQDKAARAFGAERGYFVTNGTSTSNKIVSQALLAHGDIAIVDRNCHKSHHYGMVLVRRTAALCRSLPDDGIFDVWRRAAEDHQAGALERQSRRSTRPSALAFKSACLIVFSGTAPYIENFVIGNAST